MHSNMLNVPGRIYADFDDMVRILKQYGASSDILTNSGECGSEMAEFELVRN